MLLIEAFDKDADDSICSCLINLIQFFTSSNQKISYTAKMLSANQNAGDVKLSF